MQVDCNGNQLVWLGCMYWYRETLNFVIEGGASDDTGSKAIDGEQYQAHN